MKLRATDFPKVECVDAPDPTKPRFWTQARYLTGDQTFPLLQLVQVQRSYGIVTGWQIWAGTARWAFFKEEEALRFIAERFNVGPYADTKKPKKPKTRKK